jgi:predicted secreted acid phosphatase
MRAAVFALAVATLAGCSNFSEPKPNLTHVKWRMIDWHDSGDYLRDFQSAAARADRILDHFLRREISQNYAVVFDIDETLLSNWDYLRGNDFGITLPTFNAWAETSRDPALDPMARVFAKARAYHLPIMLISGRRESLRDATVKNLTDAGYWGWTQLYLRPETDHATSVIPFKSGVRKMLAGQHYDIILNVGDQKSDLAGGYARHAVKLPNPFYYLQ